MFTTRNQYLTKIRSSTHSLYYSTTNWEEVCEIDEGGGESTGKGIPFFSKVSIGTARGADVPIIEILALGKHGPLKPSQKHTLLKSEDKPPLSRRCPCMCVGKRECML